MWTGVLGILLSASAFARPVSYTGGWTLVQTANRASTAGLLHYSVSHKVSVVALPLVTHADRNVVTD